MRVFLAATSLRPDYGGPAYSVGRLAAALAAADAKVTLWAPDGSAPDFACEGEGLVPLRGGLPGMLKVDVLHDNGIWLPHNHRLAALAAKLRLPRIVSPRGMLEPWAARHKRFKKGLAWRLYQRRDLERAQLLHATAAPEAENLERFDLGLPVQVIPNGVDVPAVFAETTHDDTPRTMLFLGRLYPVKGLPMLVEAWARVRPTGWRLVIAGPDEAGHRMRVERIVLRAGLTDVVTFPGSLTGAAKDATLRAADVVVLPSHSESFGMIVAEALAYGRPVLTTTAVPWPGLEDRACGWRVPATVDGLADGLRRATATERGALRAMGARGRAWVTAEFGWDAIAARFIAGYEHAIARVTATH